MAIITITRGQHSGGEEVAQAIADKIGARCVSNEVLREAAQKYGVSEAKVPFILSVPLNDEYKLKAGAATLKSYQIFEYAINGAQQ